MRSGAGPRRADAPATGGDTRTADPADSAAESEAGHPASGLAQTRDDTDVDWGERPDPTSRDRWLHEQRPPHWE